MSYNGTGTYVPPASSWNPAVNDTDINATDWAALLADLTTALSTCMLKDGQQVPTANLPMGGFKLTGLAAGSTAGNSVRYEQVLLLAGGTMSGVMVVPDTDLHVVGSSDATKVAVFEVDGLTTGTTRTITVPDRSLTIGPVLATEQASTSGTSIDFTGIPSGTKRITIMLMGVSTNGTSNPLIQIGDSGGIETSGYLGTGTAFTDASAVGVVNFTTGFGLAIASATAVIHGVITLTLENSATFSWAASGNFGRTDQLSSGFTAGKKATSAELDRVRITTANGTDAFDAGLINISYE